MPIITNRSYDGFSVELGDGKRIYEIKGIRRKGGCIQATIKLINLDNRREAIEHISNIYSSKQRSRFIKQAAKETKAGIRNIRTDMVTIVRAVEGYKFSDNPALETLKQHQKQEEDIINEEAREFGKSPDILKKILEDIEKVGIVGEKIPSLLAYLAVTSRLLPDPLCILLISSSGSGKSYIQGTILKMLPPECLLNLSSITPRALFYSEEKSIKNKVIALEELAGLGNGEDGAYAIRTLITSKVLTVCYPVKSFETGKMTSETKTLSGPCSIISTTTKVDIEPELKSRLLCINVDESQEQTRNIILHQAKKNAIDKITEQKEIEHIFKKHQAFQSQLRKIAVVNPYAEYLTISEKRLESRRIFQRYLALIDCLAHLHQSSREVKNFNGIEYIEVKLRPDVEVANMILTETTGKAIRDELTSNSRELLGKIKEMLTNPLNLDEYPDGKFSRRSLRQYTGYTSYRINTCLKELMKMEAILYRGKMANGQHSYSLLEEQASEDDLSALGLRSVEDIEMEIQDKSNSTPPIIYHI